MVRKDRRRNSSLNSGDLPTREASDIVTCIFTLAKFFQKKKQKHERMMAALHHAYWFTYLYLLCKPNPLSPAHNALNSLLTQLVSGESKYVLFYLIKQKFPNSDKSVLWGRNVPCSTYACLRQGEVRNISFFLCTGQVVFRPEHSQRRKRGNRTGKHSGNKYGKQKASEGLT